MTFHKHVQLHVPNIFCQKSEFKKKMKTKPNQQKSIFDLLPNWIFYYPTAIVIIVISLVYSFLFLITKNDPPSLPLHPIFQPIDCSFITANQISITGSRISINISSSQFYQYPKSATLELLRLQAKTGKIISEYHHKDFWDVESNLTHFFFNVLHPFIGETTIDLICSRLPVLVRNITIGELTTYPIGWSRFVQRDFSLLNAFDACWINESLYLSFNSQTMFEPIISSSNSTITVNASSMPTLQIANTLHLPYIYHHNSQYADIPNVLLVDSNPVPSFMKIIDILIPIFTHTYYSKNIVNQSVLLTKNQNHLIPIIEKIFDGKIQLSSETNMCYNNIMLVSSLNGVQHLSNQTMYQQNKLFPLFAHMDFITRIKPEIISDLRDKFIRKKAPKQNYIVIDSDLSNMVGIIRDIYPEATVKVIDDNDDVRLIAKMVSKASVLVCSNIFTMAYSIFLQPEVTTLIEMVPLGKECIKVGEKWATITNTRYLPLGDKSAKGCHQETLYDYFTDPSEIQYPELTRKQIKDVFDKATSM